MLVNFLKEYFVTHSFTPALDHFPYNVSSTERSMGSFTWPSLSTSPLYTCFLLTHDAWYTPLGHLLRAQAWRHVTESCLQSYINAILVCIDQPVRHISIILGSNLHRRQLKVGSLQSILFVSVQTLFTPSCIPAVLPSHVVMVNWLVLFSRWDNGYFVADGFHKQENRHILSNTTLFFSFFATIQEKPTKVYPW